MKVQANGIDIEVEDSGGSSPAVLLIMGLGMQLISWPPALVQGLVDAGYRVIRHDNRDAGLSSSFAFAGVPNMLLNGIKWKLGMHLKTPYNVDDMARDSMGVLGALGIDRAHVVGVSMGGMIAQRAAIIAPRRLLSLTSIMSGSGDPDLPQARPAVRKLMLSRPLSLDPSVQIAHSLRIWRAIGSPGFPTEEAALRERLTASVRRASNPSGVFRQMLAIVADRSRPEDLAQIEAPTLVIHGRDDVLVPVENGIDTARRIKGARLELIDGMGHDLAQGVVELMLPMLLQHFADAETGAGVGARKAAA